MGTEYFTPSVGSYLGGDLALTVNRSHAIYKPLGLTIDWGTVTAAGGDTRFNDGVLLKAGRKGLRYGQVLTMIGTAPVMTLTVSGTPSGGTFTVVFPQIGAFPAETATFAYNVSAANMLAALRGMGRFGVSGITSVALNSGVYTVTFDRRIAPTMLTIPTIGNALTGGSSPAVTPAFTTPPPVSDGKYGPFDPDATDGRQTLAWGRIVVLDTTVLEEPVIGLSGRQTNHEGALIAGDIFLERLIAGLGTASLANGPTLDNLFKYLPGLRPH